MNKTNFGLVDWARAWVGMPYWYGTACYKCTAGLLAGKTRQYPKHYTSARMPKYRAAIARGDWATDCIGLAKGYMWWDATLGKTRYATNGCPDASANGMLEHAKVKGDIATLPEMPGLMLWKSGHAGVYIGGGWAVEARGFAYGVIRTRVAGRGWAKWYQLPGCEYQKTDDGSGREAAPFAAGVTQLGARLLRNGCDGDDVRELQTALIALGYDCGAWGADGDFGYATEAAVRALQQAWQLDDDGIVGNATLGALKRQQAGEVPPSGEDGSPDEAVG